MRSSGWHVKSARRHRACNATNARSRYHCHTRGHEISTGDGHVVDGTCSSVRKQGVLPMTVRPSVRQSVYPSVRPCVLQSDRESAGWWVVLARRDAVGGWERTI
jgi:hypothetical protein